MNCFLVRAALAEGRRPLSATPGRGAGPDRHSEQSGSIPAAGCSKVAIPQGCLLEGTSVQSAETDWANGAGPSLVPYRAGESVL